MRRLIAHSKTHFFLAREADGTPALGFVHLMPSINTVAMRPIWLLEDLFRYASQPRGRELHRVDVANAEDFARRDRRRKRRRLATARENRKAQSLYKRMGYLKEEHFWYYHRKLD